MKTDLVWAKISSKCNLASICRAGVAAAALLSIADSAWAAPLTFTAGDLVVAVEGNGSNDASNGTSATGNTGASSTTYLDNQAAPLTLYEFSTTGTNQTPIGTLELPNTTVGSNSAISGEYGSSSEATLQLSGNGQYLTIAGYAVNAPAYNAASDLNGTGTALAQSCSLSNAASCAGVPQIARVIGVIGANGSVDTSTVLYNVDNENNPRSVYSTDGKSFYLSGQATGNVGDTTGGVFYTGTGPNQTPVAITGQDASGTVGSNTVANQVSQDTREVQIYNNTLYTSVDSKQGKNSTRDFIGTLGSPPATSLYNNSGGPTMLTGFGNSGGTGQVTLTSATSNGINKSGQTVNLSPQNYFFANATTLYVADDGAPKSTTASTSLGDGGLQKWSLVNGSWQLDYTLASGLNLVANNATTGTNGIACSTSGGQCSSGLYGLTGENVTINGLAEVELFATNYTLSDLDQTYLYGIADILSDMTDPTQDGSFSLLATAAAGTNFKGVAFAPVPEPSSLALLTGAFGALMLMRRRRKAVTGI